MLKDILLIFLIFTVLEYCNGGQSYVTVSKITSLPLSSIISRIKNTRPLQCIHKCRRHDKCAYCAYQEDIKLCILMKDHSDGDRFEANEDQEDYKDRFKVFYPVNLMGMKLS